MVLSYSLRSFMPNWPQLNARTGTWQNRYAKQTWSVPQKVIITGCNKKVIVVVVSGGGGFSVGGDGGGGGGISDGGGS